MVRWCGALYGYECHALISTARESAGLEAAKNKSGENVKEKFKRRGEF
ncbi:MAG TPA: hypothetical protein VIM99_15060 [Blastocatellia bacterium]